MTSMRPSSTHRFLGILAITIGTLSISFGAAAAAESMDIGQRRELFVGKQLVGKMSNVSFRLHEPQPQPLPKSPLPIVYSTIIKVGDLYRAYYRDVRKGYTGKRHDGHPGEITCYAESRDGYEWTFPQLNIFDAEGTHGKNAIWDGRNMCSHNFSPFYDGSPGVHGRLHHKALAGVMGGGGLYALGSPDGIHWKLLQDKPVMKPIGGYSFDSQNVSFWSVAEKQYVCYFRTFQTPHGKLRTIHRTTSKNFLNWTKPVAMNPNLPGEHLYTSQTQPYFRAPHIYIATPTRFRPDRGSSTDILFMSTRAGSSEYDRLFTEAFIRPGRDPDRWGNRSNYVGLNVVPTAPGEMSIYHKSGHRYTLRTDGFISVRAGANEGELLTKPLRFAGSKLELNFATSAAGSLRVEIQHANGEPIPGFALSNCKELVGDRISQQVQWKQDLAKIANTPIRLRFVMTECDLYSFRFHD
jgi:hypothetical protein